MNGFLSIFGNDPAAENHTRQEARSFVSEPGASFVSNAGAGASFVSEHGEKESAFGENGFITQVAEHIPIVNNIAQEMHGHYGREEALRRAQTRNPLGRDGVVTQAFEHIPIICDGIEYIHRSRGDEVSAERASARTLTRLFSKDGAVTKVAELLPGSNLVAAAIHKLAGNDDHAERAVNLMNSWMTAGDPDGALAKVAELFPGTDLVAFALHMKSNQYAQALRCITKTQFVNIEVEKVFLWINAQKVINIAVSSSEIRGVDANPRCLSLIVGLNDIFTTYLEENTDGKELMRPPGVSESSLHSNFSDDFMLAEGFTIFEPPVLSPLNAEEKRRSPKRRGKRRDSLGARKQREGATHDFVIVGVETEELVTEWANDFIRRVVDSMVSGIPICVEWTVDAINTYTLPRWRREGLRYRLLFNKPLPRFDAVNAIQSDGQRELPAIAKALVSSFPFFSITHTPFFESESVKLPEPRSRSCLRKTVGPAVAGATCLSCAASCGVKAVGLACMGGFLLGARQFCRWVYRRTQRHFNSYNQEAWEAAALGREPVANGGESRHNSSELPRAERKWGVMFKFPEAGGATLVNLIWDYIIKNIRCGCILAPLFHCCQPCLKAGVHFCAPEWQAVPLVLDVETGPMKIELDPEVWPDGLHLPNVRLAILIHLGLTGDLPSTVRLAIPDTIIKEIIESLRRQIGELDVRTMDPRLSGFVQPFRLDFQAALEWPKVDQAKLVIKGMKTSLHLPQ
mmetsp:Transcript_148081/g.261088  ORF Transcript_148081/g.261088 Transcript_148081/m.261088 type:complete len:742 (+) Transcript_148081:116-2341(+)